VKVSLRAVVLCDVQRLGPVTTVDAVVGSNPFRRRALSDLQGLGFVRFIASEGAPTIVYLTAKGMAALR